MTRPVEWTSPANGIALGCYWLALLLGVSLLTPLNSSPAARMFLTPFGATLWAVSMAVCGAAALVVAVLSLRLRPRLERFLTDRRWERNRRLPRIVRIERVAAAGLAFTFFVYLVVLVRSGLRSEDDLIQALLQTLTTKLLALTFVVGGIARVIQITRELRRWSRSDTVTEVAAVRDQ